MKLIYRDSPTRRELEEQMDAQQDEMKRLEESLEEKTDDLDTLWTLESTLDRSGGTADGIDRIEQAVDRAEDATERNFDGEDKELTREQKETEDFEDETRDRREGSERNLGTLSEASSGAKTKEAVDGLRESKEAAIEDQEVLQDIETTLEQAVKDSQQALERLRSIRNRGGKMDG